MKLEQAQQIAEGLLKELKPYCDRIEIAGSIRRKKPEVKDIEIVAIPKPYDVGLFESGIAIVVNKWQKVKGDLPCLYTQRILPEGIKLDLFIANKDNWGFQLAVRTGSAEFAKRLARGWVKHGYHAKNGLLNGNPVKEEKDLFNMAGIDWVEPVKREI